MAEPERLLRIWVVEDDPDDFALLRDAFERAKALCLVLRVEHGEALLERLTSLAEGQESPWPDLILLDLKLPGRDGWEVLRELKANAAWRPIPVVIWTSSDAQHEVRRAYELGACSFIAKPAGFTDLVERVRSLREYWTSTVELPRLP